jgi:uncharacterized protein YjcR
MVSKTEKLLAKIKHWCDGQRGRRVRLAEHLGVSPQQVTDWFYQRSCPTSEQTIGLIELFNNRKKLRKVATAKKRPGVPRERQPKAEPSPPVDGNAHSHGVTEEVAR